MRTQYKIYLAAGLISLMSACKKELNVYPTTSEVEGNVIVDTKSAQALLTGVYYRFADGGVDVNGVPSTNWDNLLEIYPSEFCNTLNGTGQDDGIYTLRFDPTSAPASDLWNYGYNLVNAANEFLGNIQSSGKVPDATKKQMIAEAKFLRAFGDTQLLLYFGQYNDPTSKYGIILRTESVTSHNLTMPRASVADTYTAVLSDLNAAITDLPEQNTANYYANKAAAELLERLAASAEGEAHEGRGDGGS